MVIKLKIMIEVLLIIGLGMVWINVLNFGEKFNSMVISVVVINISVEQILVIVMMLMFFVQVVILLLFIELESMVVSLLLMKVCFMYGFILCLVILVMVFRCLRFLVIRIIVIGVINIIVWLLKDGVVKCGSLNYVVWVRGEKFSGLLRFRLLVSRVYSVQVMIRLIRISSCCSILWVNIVIMLMQSMVNIVIQLLKVLVEMLCMVIGVRFRLIVIIIVLVIIGGIRCLIQWVLIFIIIRLIRVQISLQVMILLRVMFR